MQLTIHRILLWAKKEGLPPRSVQFQPDKVNVITGQSQSGKSSLISIVDYVLGSDKCAIPVGLIRETVAWFGVQLKTSSGFLTLARRNPEGKVSTGDMFLQDTSSDDIPSSVKKNANVDEVKAHLDRIGRLPSIDFKGTEEGGSGFDARPSFRDLVAFTFQPQHIVANPYTLFFKADTEEHRRKLANVLPYVLEAITIEQMLSRRRLQELEQTLRRLKDAYEVRQSTIATMFDDLQSQFVRARELGLLDSTVAPMSNWQVEDYVRVLEAGLTRVTGGETFLVAGGTANAVGELSRARELEDDLSRQLGRARAKLARIEQLQFASRGYKAELDQQRKRLDGLGWFQSVVEDSHGCPLCGSNTDSASRELEQLKLVASEARQVSEKLEGAPVVLDKEAQQTTGEIADLETRLARVRRRLRVLEDASVRAAEGRQRLPEVFRFAGQLETMLANYRAADKGADLAKQIVDTERERDALGRGLDSRSQRQREEAALKIVSQSMAHYAAELNLERRDDTATISVSNLAVRVSGKSGRDDFLWEIGSGENWVGYHLAALLSLHEFFLSRTWSPVPSFLMIDQPSQVYFPERWPGDAPTPTMAGGAQDFRAEDADIQGVRRIFSALASAVERTKGRLQLIVTDHAGSITWEGLPIHVVEEWRAGKNEFLIPSSWLAVQ
ncbi:MAG: hypothetical protein AMXMBFR58_00190 [Phycisphaerae bacterium]